MVERTSEYALVLAGGGGRGAYQIGVIKALEELGYTENITAVSGASVGALNAALFACTPTREAESIWRHLKQEKLTDFSDLLDVPGMISAGGLFKRKGLEAIIYGHNIGKRLSESDILCYAACADCSSRKVRYFKLNGDASPRIHDILMASSAVPFVFQPQMIDGRMYMDGGQALPDRYSTTNAPVQPLYNVGYRRFIVVYLSEEREKQLIVNKSSFPDTEFIELFPSNKIYGDVLIHEIIGGGMGDFTSESAVKRIEAGYEETLQFFYENILENVS